MKCPLSDDEMKSAHIDAEARWTQEGWPAKWTLGQIELRRRRIHDEDIATAAYAKGKADASPTRADTEAAIRSAWNHFGSIDHIIKKLFKEIEG